MSAYSLYKRNSVRRSVEGFGVGALQVIFHASRNSYGSENDRASERASSMTGLKLGPNERTNERGRKARPRERDATTVDLLLSSSCSI